MPATTRLALTPVSQGVRGHPLICVPWGCRCQVPRLLPDPDSVRRRHCRNRAWSRGPAYAGGESGGRVCRDTTPAGPTPDEDAEAAQECDEGTPLQSVADGA